MKKGLKITLISLVSLLVIVVLAGTIAIATLLSPNKLTKIVNKEAPKFLTCKFHLDKVDLTFFKTFPKIGLEIHNLTLINPVYGAHTDTLLDVKSCVAALNIRDFLKNDNIHIYQVKMSDGIANLFVNPSGQSNYDIIAVESNKEPTAFTYTLDLDKIATDNVDVKYIDLQHNLLANIQDIQLHLNGKWEDQHLEGKADLSTGNIDYKTLDSTRMNIHCDKMDFHYKGDLQDNDNLSGDLRLHLAQARMKTIADTYFDSLEVALNSTLNARLSSQNLHLENTTLNINRHELALSGDVQRDTASGNIRMNLDYKTGMWPLQEMLSLIPEIIIGDALSGMQIDGDLGLSGTIVGNLNEEETPIVTADVNLRNGTFSTEQLPLSFDKINATVGVNLNLAQSTDLDIHTLSCYTGRNHITASGTVRDLLNRMCCNLNLKGDLHLEDFKKFLPDDITRCRAMAHADLHTQFDLEQIQNLDLNKIQASGRINLKDLDLLYNDSLSVQTPSADLELRFPVHENPYNITEWAAIKLSASKLSGNMISLAKVNTEGLQLDGYISNPTDSSISFLAATTYHMDEITVYMDTIGIMLQQPSGHFIMKDEHDLALLLNGDALSTTLGEHTAIYTQKLSIDAQSDYNDKESNTLLKWNPTAAITLSQGVFTTSGLETPLNIQQLKANLTTHRCAIKQAQGRFGSSDFNLRGDIVNLDQYLSGEGQLTGKLELTSNYIDINQIMDIVSGMGVEDSVMAELPESSKDDPFMVPYGMDIRLNTHISKALYEDVEVRNIGGHISLKDGVLVLDEMGLTSDAARMQLTAMYKSPRKNHLFLGLDFHLLDIKIDKLIEMIPEVDTILPMLKSFAGNAEFHFAIETYLKSNYDLKYSTLRGAAAINGKDLVVLDQETYNKISKLLRFKKGTTNRIDELSAEATIYKNEIDVYPFAVSIDKYQAVLSGRHNLDMTYNYNISLLKPIQLGVDIIGTDKRKFKVGKAKYATMFKPEKQNVVEQNVMRLKSQINEALKANVKEQP